MIFIHCAVVLLLKGCAPHNWWRLLKLLGHAVTFELKRGAARINASILKPVYTLYNLSLRIPVHMINLHLRIETGAIEYKLLCSNNFRAKNSILFWVSERSERNHSHLWTKSPSAYGDFSGMTSYFDLIFVLLIIFAYFLFLFFYLTDFLRLEVLIQEKTIAKLQESVKSLTILNRKCDRQSRKNRKFLQTLIQQTKTDNVPLTEDHCSKLCNEHKVKGADCDTLCISKRVQCAHWPDTSKCLKHTGKGSNRRKKRETQSAATETILSPKHTGCLQNTTCLPDYFHGI